MLNPLVFALGSIFEINPYVDSTDICAFFLLIIAHALALFYSRMHLDSLRDANALETVKSAMCGVFKDQEQIKNMQDKMLQVKAALGIRSYYSILLDLALSKYFFYLFVLNFRKGIRMLSSIVLVVFCL